MRFLVTGAGGQLGSDLLDLLPGSVGLTRTQLSVADRDAVLGVRRLIVPWLAEERRKDKAAWLAVARSLNTVGEQLRRHGYPLHAAAVYQPRAARDRAGCVR